tara:strand:- start:726 stop:2042 length:1317 start_codon:yes stop_codon:yes gene_type:complete
VQNFLFSQSVKKSPIIITTNGVFEFKSKWEYTPFANNSFKKEINEMDVLNHANFFTIINSNKLYMVSNGAGPVFIYRNNNFERIDNSSLHKNQFGGARFIYNNKIHIYGGYGFWSFKSFITFFDENISQWDLIYNDSKYIPHGRWKPIYNIINDKLYVLGGRSGSSGLINQDESFSDIFYFDFIEKEFINVGKLNPRINPKYTLFSAPKIEDNILILNNKHLTKIDFQNLTFTDFHRGKAFSGVDNKYPSFIDDKKLYYISDLNGEKLLNSIDIASIDAKFSSETFPLIINESKVSFTQYILFGFFIAFVFWVVLKIFSFKDFIKGLILYDENNIYFNNDSVFISSKEKQLISFLSENPFITAPQVNSIISEQNFAKSHFTSLRNKLVDNLNNKLFQLTKIEKCIIETKDPNDNRIKAYKADSIIKKKTGFLSFVFKR